MSHVTIRTNVDEAAACRLFDVSPEELATRFAETDVLGWWFAYDATGAAAGVAVATHRADGRTFVVYRLASDSAFRPLIEHALDATDGPANVTVDANKPELVRSAVELGLTEELSSLKYDVPFDSALAALPPQRQATRFTIVSAGAVEMDDLFELDTELRGDVPGSEGWTGNRAWFDDEMTSPECDPDGYQVAVDRASTQLLGLCRMWRNPSGPTLGMLGARRTHRTGFMATELLRATLVNSSEWGHSTFDVHTARPGLQRHLRRVGARPAGGFTRFVRP